VIDAVVVGDRGVERVRKALRKERVDERSWILFFDADLAVETRPYVYQVAFNPTRLPTDILGIARLFLDLLCAGAPVSTTFTLPG